MKSSLQGEKLSALEILPLLTKLATSLNFPSSLTSLLAVHFWVASDQTFCMIHRNDDYTFEPTGSMVIVVGDWYNHSRIKDDPPESMAI